MSKKSKSKSKKKPNGTEKPVVVETRPPAPVVPMKADEYNDIVERLGRNRRTAADLFGVSVRQSQRFAAGDLAVPRPVAKLARAATRFHIEPDVLEKL